MITVYRYRDVKCCLCCGLSVDARLYLCRRDVKAAAADGSTEAKQQRSPGVGLLSSAEHSSLLSWSRFLLVTVTKYCQWLCPVRAPEL